MSTDERSSGVGAGGRLEGLSVALTGGGSGLGRAIVGRFVDEGAWVTVLERSADKVEQLRDEHGASVVVVEGDATTLAGNAAMVGAAVERFGGLDVFIGNAGVWDFGQALLDLDDDLVGPSFDELFAVNVKAYVLGAKASMQALGRRRGSMVFTLSNASFFPAGGGVLYTASKHAGLGVVRQLAYELAPDIRVNGVAPGGMATDLRGPSALTQQDRKISDMPIRKWLAAYSALELAPEPEDYVGAYVFLAAPGEARTTTGSVLDLSSVGTPRRPSPPPET